MLTAWDAVSTLDRMLNDVMGSTLGTATTARTFQPAIDVRFSDAEVTFVCDLPGVKLEDVEVTIENGALTLKGTRRFESKEGEQVMLGRAYGTFTRIFALPDSVDENNLTASLADGVLTVRVPKHAKARPRKVEIKGGPEPKHLEE
jgi:HSP20 family protein